MLKNKLNRIIINFFIILTFLSVGYMIYSLIIVGTKYNSFTNVIFIFINLFFIYNLIYFSKNNHVINNVTIIFLLCFQIIIFAINISQYFKNINKSLIVLLFIIHSSLYIFGLIVYYFIFFTTLFEFQKYTNKWNINNLKKTKKNLKEIIIPNNSLFLDITKNKGDNSFKKTVGPWKIDLKKIEKCRLVFAFKNHFLVGVFKIRNNNNFITLNEKNINNKKLQTFLPHINTKNDSGKIIINISSENLINKYKNTKIFTQKNQHINFQNNYYIKYN